VSRDERTAIGLALGMLLTYAAATMALAGCPVSQPPRPAASDAGAPPSSAELCLKLVAIGCAEGFDKACQPKIEQVAAERLTVFPARCWMAAQTRDEVRACGGIVCKEP